MGMNQAHNIFVIPAYYAGGGAKVHVPTMMN